MAKLVPVDFDPFGGAAPEGQFGPKLVPVDFDPFESPSSSSAPPVPFATDAMGNPIPVEEPPVVDDALVAKIRAEREAGRQAPQQIPLAVNQPALVGTPANVPLPQRRPTAPTGEFPVQPLEEAAARSGGTNLDKIIGAETGMLTPEESVRQTQEKIAAAEAGAEQAAITREATKSRQAEELRAFVDKDGVPFVDKIADLQAQKDAAENRTIAKQLQVQINNVVANAPFEFRQLLAQQKLGISEEQEAEARAEQAKQAETQAKLAPPVTQTFARSALETTGQAITKQTADTITGLQRVATSPVSLIEAVTGNEDIISKEIDREGRELSKNLSGGFAPDPAQAEDLGMKVVQGVASTAGFAATGGVITKALALPRAVTIAIAGGLPQAEQGWQEALRRQEEDPTLGGWRKWASFTTNLGIGATEAIPIGNLLNKLEKASKGGVTRYFGMVAANAGEEGIQEGMSQLLQNTNSIVVLKDPNATITKDVAENALVGALSGAIFSGGLGAAPAGVGKMRDFYKTPENTPSILRPVLFPEYKKEQEAAAAANKPIDEMAKIITELEQAPAVPEKDQAAILKGAGYAIDDIVDMTPGQRDYLAREAVQQNVEPAELTEDEAAMLAPEAPVVQPSPEQQVEAPEAALSPPPPEAPSARAEQLVEQGVAPLEAMQQAAAEPIAAVEPVAAEVPPVEAPSSTNEIIHNTYVAKPNTPYQKVGNIYKIIPLNKSAWNKYFGYSKNPDGTKHTFEQYVDYFKNLNEQVPKYVVLTKKEGEKSFRGEVFITAQEVNDYFQARVDKGWFLPVKDENSAEAKDWMGIKEPKPISEPVAEAPTPEVAKPEVVKAAPAREVVTEEPALSEEKGHLYGSVNPARLVSILTENPAGIKRVGKKNVSEVGVDSIKLRIDPSAFPSFANQKEAIANLPQAIKEVIVGKDAYKGLNEKQVRRLNDALSKIEQAGGKVITVGEPPVFEKVKRKRATNELGSFIAQLGGLRGTDIVTGRPIHELANIKDRKLPGLWRKDGGLELWDAFKSAIPDFYPQFEGQLEEARDYGSSQQKEMLDQFVRDLEKGGVYKGGKRAEELEIEKAAQAEQDRYEPYVNAIEEALKKANIEADPDIFSVAVMILERGEVSDPMEAYELATLEAIANDPSVSKPIIHDIVGDEFWSTLESQMIPSEGEALPAEVEPMEADLALEAEQPPAPEAGAISREAVKPAEKPAPEAAPEGAGKGVEKPVAGKPEEKVRTERKATITKHENYRGRSTPEVEWRVTNENGKIIDVVNTLKEAKIRKDLHELSKEEFLNKYPEFRKQILDLTKPAEEKGAEGKPQLVIPGAEKIGEKEQLERQAAKPMRGAAEQKEPGGMFGPAVGQKDLMDLAKETLPMPESVVKGKTPSPEEKEQRDKQNIQSDIPPEGIAPPLPDISLADAQAILRGKNIQINKVGDKFVASGKTFKYRDVMKNNLGRFNPGQKTWEFAYDPTKNIAASIKDFDSATSATRDGGDDSGAVSEQDENERISKLRAREDARPDERIADPASKVSAETKQLISNGLKFGIPQEVVTDQIEDIGMAVNAFEKKKPMFLLANEAGTGKTFVLGGIIRELRNKGVKKFVYVTQNQDLITQIKKDLAPYGINDVDFVTYSKMDSNPNGGVLIFDEAHNIKNIQEGKGRAIDGQKMMRQAGMTIFASATPFQNPSETEYLAGTGVYGDVPFDDWAKAYGASSRTKRFFNPHTKKEQTVKTIYWVNTAENKKNGAAARQWFLKQGIMTQRAMKIDPKMVDVTFKREKVDEKWVDLYNRVMKAYDLALNRFTSEDGRSLDTKMTGEIMRHRESMIKRILEASKINAAIERAKELLKEGKYVVIFVETKADRTIGRFRRSEHFKDDKLYTFPEMEEMMSEWNQEAAMAKMNDEKPPPRPFAAFIYEIAAAMHESNLDTELPSTADDILAGLGGEDKVAVYTGAVAGTTATKNKNDFMAGKKKVLIATMAKGGTGLSLHDTVGNRPTVQLNINLPWAAWQVDQVSARVARYGLKSKAMIEWMFASNIPWESERLVPRVGARMADMGAIVKGIEIKAAEKLLGDFDFEGEMDVKQAQGEGKIQYSAFTTLGSEIAPDVIDRIRSALSRMVGNSVALKFYDNIIMEDPEAATRSGAMQGDAAAGFYDNANGIIGLALQTAQGESPIPALYHEVYHAVESVLTPAEINALNRSEDQIKKLVLENYPDLFDSESYDRLDPSEKRAYAMGAYGYLRDRKQAIPAGPVRTILSKVWNIWQSIVRAVRDVLGRRGMEDVFNDIYIGNLKTRMAETAKEMKVTGKAYAKAGPSLPGLGPQPAPRKPVQQKLPGLPTPKAAVMQYTIDRSDVGSDLVYKLVDKYVDLADLQKAIETARGSPLPEGLDVYMALQLYQDRVIARQNKTWENEILPMTKAMEKAKVSVDDLGLLAYALHAAERNEEMQRRDPTRFVEGGSGLTDQEAQDIIDDFKAEGKHDAIKKILDDHLYPLLRKDTAMRYAAGLLTQDQFNQYTRPRSQGGYDFYVPLTGYAEDEAELTGKPMWTSGIGRGFPIYGKEYKTAFGRESLALNPVYSAINRRMEGITRAEKQRVDLALYNLIKNYPNPDFAEIVKPGDEYVKKIGADGTVQYVSSSISSREDNVISLKIGGKEVYIRFNMQNPNMARFVKELKSIGEDAGKLMKVTMAMGRYLSKINTQWVLDFFLVNFPRDLQDALINMYGTKEGLSTSMLSNVASAAKIIAKYNVGGELTTQDKALLDEWKDAGGQLDYGGFRTAEKNMEEIDRLLRKNLGVMSNTEKGIEITKKASMGVLNAIETINDTFDNTVRLAVYMAARQNGLTKDRAAQLSRRATIDFKTGGKYKPLINAIYPFSGAAIAGSRGLYRLWKSPRGRKALISMVMISALNSLLGTYMSDDDDVDKTKKEFWTKIKPNERTNSIIIPVKVKGRYIRIPIGFYLQPFWVMGDQIAGVTLGQIGPTDAAVNIATAFSNAFNPLGSGSLIYNILPVQYAGVPIRPAIEAWQNEDWLGSQMHPERKGLAKSAQYYDKTSDTSITIADTLNRRFGGNPFKSSIADIYPSNIDFWASYITGGVGRFAMGSAKGIFDFFEGNETPLEKMPFVRRYVTSEQNLENAAYSKLKKQVDEQRATQSSAWSKSQDKTVSAEERQEAKKVARELKKELGTSLAGKKVEAPTNSLPGIFRETDKKITKIEDQIDKIKLRSDLSPKDQKALTKPLEDRIIELKNQARRKVIDKQQRLNPPVSPLKQLQMLFQ